MEFTANSNFIKDTGLKENIPGSKHVALGGTLSSYNNNNNGNSSIMQESYVLDIIKSLQNADESVTDSRTIPSSLTSTKGLIDTSGNSMSKDTALPDTV